MFFVVKWQLRHQLLLTNKSYQLPWGNVPPLPAKGDPTVPLVRYLVQSELASPRNMLPACYRGPRLLRRDKLRFTFPFSSRLIATCFMLSNSISFG